MDPLGTQSQTGKTNTCNKHMLCAMHEIQNQISLYPLTYYLLDFIEVKIMLGRATRNVEKFSFLLSSAQVF